VIPLPGLTAGWLLLSAIGGQMLALAAGSLPVWMEPNRGQFGAGVEFMARSGSWQASVDRGEVSFASGSETVRVQFPGSRVLQAPVAEGKLAGVSSYFRGNNPAGWISGVPHYSRLRYRDFYPGIDLIYYGSASGKLEYDFEVSPAADASRIRMAFSGVDRVEHRSNGDLLLTTPSGQTLVQRRPVVYEEYRGVRQEIAATYEVARDHSVRVALSRSRSHPDARLVVDPVIEYSTFIGGNAFEAARGVACDHASGYCFLAGEGRSRNGLVGPLQSTGNGGQEVIVVKLNPSNNAVAYYAVLGGDFDETANAIVVDTSGHAYVAGVTRSQNFPTRSAAQPSPGGPLFQDGFVAKLSPDGTSLMYSTYLGGTGAEETRGLAVDRTGAAYVVGSTTSRDSFPLTPGALQTAFRGSLLQQSTTGYVTKLHPSGNRLVYSTLLGGSRQDDVRTIAVDESGAAIVAGTTTSLDFPVRNALQPILASSVSGFLTKINAEGSQTQFSTYYGGPAINSLDAIVLDASGAIVIGGSTSATGFQTKNAAQPGFGGGRSDAIVAKISAAGNEVLWATYLGGSEADSVLSLALHRDGSVSCSGVTSSQNFPQRSSPLTASGKMDGFVTRISTSGDALVSSMVVGGAEDDRVTGLSVDGTDMVFAAGLTGSRDFPVRTGALQSAFGGGTGDMFLLRIAPDGLTTSLTPSPLVVSSTVVSFVSTVNNPRQPAPAALQVTSITAQPMSFTVEWSLTGPGNWLSAGPQRGETPAVLNIFANPATLPPGTYQGMVRITPVTGGGQPTVVNVSFQILNPPAEISSLAPAWLPAGAGDTEVTLRGRGFAQGASVQMTPENANGVQLVSPTNISASSVTFLAPRSALFRDGSFELRVLNPEAMPSNPVSLLVGGRALQVAPISVVHAATGGTGGIAPGQMILISGAGLGPGELTRADVSSGLLPTKLEGVRVLIDGIAAPLVFVWDRQICAMAPYSIAGAAHMELVVESQANRSNSILLPVVTTQPGIFTVDSWVYGYGTIWNEGGGENAAAAPARKGTVVSFVMTGAGIPSSVVAPLQPLPDGRINVPPFDSPVHPITVYVDGQETELISVADAPGQMSGLMLVRARVPQNVRSGEVGLAVKAGDVLSPAVKLMVE
jgi:uncharacterized protein (TIGR03437 family)